MFRSDASSHQAESENFIGNTDNINIDVISEIEKELLDSPDDMISLVFLLYDVPDTALQRLTVYQRVYGDVSSSNLNLLHEWFRHAKSRSSWKHEFLEALLICQLNSIVRKLGFHVPSMKKHYQPFNMNVKKYINPTKKVLYKLCDNMNTDNLLKLKKSLLTYQIDTMEYENCELIFLKLMCLKFIVLEQFEYNKKIVSSKYQIENLAKIIESLPGLQVFAKELRSLQNINEECDEPVPRPLIATSTPMSKPVSVDIVPKQKTDNNVYGDSFEDVYDLINQLNLEDANNENLKSDTKKIGKDGYEIKNPKRSGVCIIINQEDFYPSKDSIKDNTLVNGLEQRLGSNKDKIVLEKTMSLLNFEVLSHTNLDHDKMFEYIKCSIKDKVHEDDSIFILCILSHGVRGHVYAADSVKVKVEDIQTLLDSDDAKILRHKPKVMIIQACQVDDGPNSTLVADSPPSNYYLRKSDFLIYWATAPEYEAFRDEKRGSIFIQVLCKAIQKLAKEEHLYDIFTKVTNCVTGICTKLKRAQVPIFESTLRKKLYLLTPD